MNKIKIEWLYKAPFVQFINGNYYLPKFNVGDDHYMVLLDFDSEINELHQTGILHIFSTGEVKESLALRGMELCTD